jgi:hypothetical protein
MIDQKGRVGKGALKPMDLNKTCFKRAHISKIGLICATNRFHHINGKIPMIWLNKGYNSYKIECKKLLLSFSNQFYE